MAREIHRFGVTVAPGSTPAAPQVFPLTMPVRIVTEIDIIVPRGPAGQVGFAIGAAGVPVLPYEPGQYFVTDNEKIYWPLSSQIESGAWQCFAYNTGLYAHTLEIRFQVELPIIIATTRPVTVAPDAAPVNAAPEITTAPALSGPAPATLSPLPLALVGAGLPGG